MKKKGYKIVDPVPRWMKKRPTTAMKMEWENACARWLI